MTHDWPQTTRKLAAAIEHARLAGSQDPDGQLSPAMHALIALAIAVALRSESWITHCAEVAVREGVTREQAIEAMGVAFAMAETPQLTDASAVLAVFDRHRAG